MKVPRVLSRSVVALALCLSACAVETEATERVTATAAGETAAPTSEQTTGPTDEATPEPSPITATFKVGEVVTITQDGEPWADFTVQEVQQATEFVDPDGYFNDTPQTEGYVYLAARVHYEALTDGVSYGSFDFQVFVDGRAVEGFAFATHGPEPDLSSGTLPEGRTAEGWLLYEVPPAGEVLLSYSGNMFLNEAPVFEVVLREG